MLGTINADRKDISSFLKPLLNSKLVGNSPAFEKALASFCEELIDHQNLLSKNYWVTERETVALRCAAILLSAGIALSRDESATAALGLVPSFFQAHFDLAEIQPETIECLKALNSSERPEKITYREIFYDAVVSMEAQKDYEDRLILKNSLYHKNSGSVPSNLDWIDQEIESLRSVEFKTFAGQVLYGRRLEKNLTQMREMKSLFEGKGMPEEHEKKLLTLYRSISRNMIDMISIADKKAGLLLSANAISLSLVVSFLSKGGSEAHPGLWPAAIVIAGTCALTVLFASLAARPVNRPNNNLSLSELLNQNRSILHYGNAARLDLKDFSLGFKRVMNDNQLLEEGLIEELHFYSKRIITKLRMVRVAYLTMFSGILMSFLALIFSRYL